MYRPLPDGLTIKESNVQGLGLFATQDFEADLILGIVHVMNKNFPHGAIRTALGAFYNHSEEPNCINVKGFWHQIPVCYLQTIKPILAGEELTAKYTLYGDFDMENT
jgi:SET domain-containing protein|tara:strand:- start:15867 stop:16187 length:321 start_codon:yes stop_codon:yes gene_type:complete